MPQENPSALPNDTPNAAQQQTPKVAIKRTPVSSSNILSIGYDKRTKTLEVMFKSGGLYRYANVPEVTYQSLMAAQSKGEFFARWIKNSFPATKVG